MPNKKKKGTVEIGCYWDFGFRLDFTGKSDELIEALEEAGAEIVDNSGDGFMRVYVPHGTNATNHTEAKNLLAKAIKKAGFKVTQEMP